MESCHRIKIWKCKQNQAPLYRDKQIKRSLLKLVEHRKWYANSSFRGYRIRGAEFEATKELSDDINKKLETEWTRRLSSGLIKNCRGKLINILARMYEKYVKGYPRSGRRRVSPLNTWKAIKDSCSNYRYISLANPMSRVHRKLLKKLTEDEYSSHEIERVDTLVIIRPLLFN